MCLSALSKIVILFILGLLRQNSSIGYFYKEKNILSSQLTDKCLLTFSHLK